MSKFKVFGSAAFAIALLCCAFRACPDLRHFWSGARLSLRLL